MPVILSADWSISRMQSWTCASLPAVAEFVKLTQGIVIEIQRQSADLYRVQLCNRQFFVVSTAIYVVKVYECHPLDTMLMDVLQLTTYHGYSGIDDTLVLLSTADTSCIKMICIGIWLSFLIVFHSHTPSAGEYESLQEPQLSKSCKCHYLCFKLFHIWKFKKCMASLPI